MVLIQFKAVVWNKNVEKQYSFVFQGIFRTFDYFFNFQEK